LGQFLEKILKLFVEGASEVIFQMTLKSLMTLELLFKCKTVFLGSFNFIH